MHLVITSFVELGASKQDTDAPPNGLSHWTLSAPRDWGGLWEKGGAHHWEGLSGAELLQLPHRVQVSPQDNWDCLLVSEGWMDFRSSDSCHLVILEPVFINSLKALFMQFLIPH